MFPIGLAAGLAGSLFKRGGNARNGYNSARDSALSQAGSYWNKLGSFGDQNNGYFNKDNPLMHDTAYKLAESYMHVPTSQEKAAAMAPQITGLADSYAGAQARLDSRNANAGMDAGSSASTGGSNTLARSFAEGAGGVKSDYWRNYLSPEAKNRGLMKAFGVYDELASGDARNLTGAYNSAGSGMGGVANQWNQYGNEAEAAQQAEDQQGLGTASGLGNLLGEYLTPGGSKLPMVTGGAKASTAPGSSGQWGFDPSDPLGWKKKNPVTGQSPGALSYGG